MTAVFICLCGGLFVLDRMAVARDAWRALQLAADQEGAV